MEDSMTNPGEHQSSMRCLRAVGAIRALTIVFVLIAAMGQAAQAQTFQVLHAFTGGPDGGTPYAGLTLDKGGNLYGTAYGGGDSGNGTVYKLAHKGSGWVFNPLYSFTGSSDGGNPQARVIFGPNGTLYGTTYYGGAYDLGTAFNLRPSASACKAALCPWTETALYSFEGSPTDGAHPGYGDLTFDQAGNAYGTTYYGGAYGGGVVYELVPAGRNWTENVLYSFGSGSDGSYPQSGVVLDNSGNLYGTTVQGGSRSDGTVFQLAHSGSSWTENLLYGFDNGSDGAFPVAGLIFDQSGNLYGATSEGGTGGQGTVFELTPANGSWTFSVLYSLIAPPGGFQCGPWGTLVMDGEGNLYGTERCNGANNLGTVFKLTPSGGGWTYTPLHDFTGGNDGKYPYCNVILDANGNLYGTASAGGANSQGVVWEISSQ
jgi:uncharacterized repeat protein (TIGR03803 family)